MENCMENARALSEGLESTRSFDIISKERGVPLVTFKLKDSSQHTVFEISESLRRFGWVVPAYTMPPDAEHVAVLRVVIREDFSRSLGERLVADIGKVLKEIDARRSLSSKIESIAAGASDGVAGNALKKSVTEMQQGITSFWKRFAERKKTSGAC